ncbi:hypothetical protein RHGRI_034220 [Rhododendron griersonianum]|uniref:Uncharacterized protein n=1 Tax=Rhododendron griersonianum TaxID=479676 RepID=A0AAV6I2Y6_9ERIC|nr:hypothetical protein RHGRI_034220 [Rhododendron griersonianum]
MLLETYPWQSKLNFFDCGGVAVSMAMSHEVGDFSSLNTFVNSCAAAVRGDCDVLWPRLDAASLFPPTDTTGFPLYEADRLWVNSPFMPFRSGIWLVVFSDAQSGDGVEAWVTSKADDIYG